MINLLYQEVNRWLTSNHDFIVARKSISIHLDELLHKDAIKKFEVVELSVQAFIILREQVQKLQIPMKSGLVIPLRMMSKKIERAVPHNLEAVKHQVDIEPPSLYLLDWLPAEDTETFEEYRSSLAFRLIDPPLKGVEVTYREVRYTEAIENDWEFARGIYIEHYPVSSFS